MYILLCRKIIKRFTKRGDIILDPMCGIGTTIVEGMKFGRNVIGVEYEKKFVNICERNIELLKKHNDGSLGWGMIIRGDVRKMEKILYDKFNQTTVPSGEIDAIIMSPPYMNENRGAGLQSRRLEGKLTPNDVRIGNCIKPFSNDPGNIDNMKRYGSIDSIIFFPSSLCSKKDMVKARPNPSEKNYLSEMLKVYVECYNVIREEGLMIIVTKNFVRNHRQVRLDLDTIKLCRHAGFRLEGRYYRRITHKSFWALLYEKKWEKKYPNKSCPIAKYEDILIFKK